MSFANMKCKGCGAEFHHCSSCGYDTWMDAGYCNKNCFLISPEYKKERAEFENLLDRLSDDAIRCLLVFLGNENHLMEFEYEKIAEERLDKTRT